MLIVDSLHPGRGMALGRGGRGDEFITHTSFYAPLLRNDMFAWHARSHFPLHAETSKPPHKRVRVHGEAHRRAGWAAMIESMETHI